MTTQHHTANRRTSEGAPLTPEPYLLDKGPFPIRRQQQQAAHKPLRLIKPAPARTKCVFCTRCPVTPECTGRCAIQQAEEAQRSHYAAHHTQRAAMPPVTPTTKPASNPRERRVVWALLIAWCIGCLGYGLWLAWSAFAA